MRSVYLTYDVKLKQHLKNKGIRYIICGLSPSEPHNTFWVYERNELFNETLNEWLSQK
jgi:hypothetical protein